MPRCRVCAPLLLALVLALLCAGGARAKDPAVAITSAVVNVQGSDDVFYGTSAADEGWGASLPSQQHRGDDQREWYQVLSASAALGDAFGCSSASTLIQAVANASNSAGGSTSRDASETVAEVAATLGLPAANFVLLVDRGGCTFAEKAYYAQEIGAAALLVTDTMEQAYNRSSTGDADAQAIELSCDNGAAEASGTSAAALASFEASGWEDLVNVAKCTESSSCKSDRCIPSGSGLQVCCAWDIPDYMGFGTSAVVSDESAITIPVIRLTMADGYTLKSRLSGNATGSSSSGSASTSEDVRITFYARDPPSADPAQGVLWLLAVATVLMGAYQGAAFERTTAQLQAALAATDTTSSEDTAQARVAYEEHLDANAGDDGATLDLTIYHAVGFLVVASAFLLLMFYVDIVLVVVVLFAIGAVSSTFHVLWAPLFGRFGGFASRYYPMKNWLWQWEGVFEPAAWSLSDLLALPVSIGVSVFWFLTRHEGYSWVLQDVFGMCLCLLFLRTLRLPSVKIASVLLVLVFCYDIFMVFVSPYIFKTSVMIKVATSGSSSSAGTAFCIRYPTDSAHDCVSESMPLLFRMPKVLDWRDSTTMLGFGDIVLPGLLLVFCARYDYATRGQLFGKVSRPLLVRIKSFRATAGGVGASNQSVPPARSASAAFGTTDGLDAIVGAAGAGNSPELSSDAVHHSRRGITCMLLWGYAIGLFLANLVVSLTGDGQPALMYLVPCTLGLLAIIAWRRGIWSKLWSGPPELKSTSSASTNDGDHTTGAGAGPGGRPRGFSLESGKPASELVLMNDHTPVSGSYAISESTPSERSKK
jgi:signal peptide peptidase-like protein 2B